jgi:undecaprenyl pyrophosphate phosphatase UppP
MMSVVAVGGAAALKLPELTTLPAGAVGPLLIGALAALVCGIAAIWLFVRLLRTRAFYRFAYYTWGAGALFLLWLAWS